MRTAWLAVQHGRGGRLHGVYLYVRVLLLQVLGDTADGAARAYAGYEDVYLTFRVSPYLRARGGVVLGRVGQVLKLLQDDRAGDVLAQFLGSLDGTSHAVLAACQLHLCTVSLHEVAALDGHRLRHGQNEVVPLDGTDESQTHTSVARGRLDDGGTRLEDALLLCVLHHSEGDAVLYAAAGIEELHFCDDGSLKTLGSRKLVEFEQRCLTNKLGE